MVINVPVNQGCVRPVFACRDWDWDSVYPVSILDTETESFKIGIKFWDWDFIKMVSIIETDTETFDFGLKNWDWDHHQSQIFRLILRLLI